MARVEKAHNLAQTVKDFQQAKNFRRFTARSLQNKGGVMATDSIDGPWQTDH